MTVGIRPGLLCSHFADLDLTVHPQPGAAACVRCVCWHDAWQHPEMQQAGAGKEERPEPALTGTAQPARRSLWSLPMSWVSSVSCSSRQPAETC